MLFRSRVALDTTGQVGLAFPSHLTRAAILAQGLARAFDAPHHCGSLLQPVRVGDGGTICQFFFDTNHGKLVRTGQYACRGRGGSQPGANGRGGGPAGESVN